MAQIATSLENRYQVVNRIASGGMGEVYRGHDPVLQRDVAIKILHPHLAGDRGFVDRFRREARAAGMLNHPNIVGVYDWGSTDGTYFMVMEFIPGLTLRMLIAEVGRMQPGQVVEVAMPVLAALDHAHRHGIVHRDIKPENILISREGAVKVADFGLARAYAESSVSQTDGTVTGTVQYLAPEQIQGYPADPRTDLYALGVVMFEMLSARAPFAGETSLAIAYQHLSSGVPAPSAVVPSVPPQLDRLVLWTTERDPAARPSSARALAREIRRAAPSLPPARSAVDLAATIPQAEAPEENRATTVTIPRVASAPTPPRRRPGWLVAGLLAALLALAGSAWAAWAYIVPHYTTVPSVVGLTATQAEGRLGTSGLRVRTGFGQFSASLPAGRIITTRPPPGARVSRGDVVTLVPSLGPQLVPVPAVEGKSEARAKKILRANGFTPKVKRSYDESIATGKVIRQSTEAGVKLEKGAPVTITVSRGPAPVEIPDVAGRQSADAKLTLETLKFKVQESAEFSTSVERGVVIRTDPPAGERALPGSDVTTVVSKGPREFPMPDVVGMSVTEARQQLEGRGLNVKLVRLPGFRGDRVKLQQPDAGATVREGDEVSIYA